MKNNRKDEGAGLPFAVQEGANIDDDLKYIKRFINLIINDLYQP
jgi:hypothetical protein